MRPQAHSDREAAVEVNSGLTPVMPVLMVPDNCVLVGSCAVEISLYFEICPSRLNQQKSLARNLLRYLSSGLCTDCIPTLENNVIRRN